MFNSCLKNEVFVVEINNTMCQVTKMWLCTEQVHIAQEHERVP